MKKTLLNILLGASLIFGNLNKAKAQECECQTYNHDADEFPEEVICWKTKEPDKKTALKDILFLIILTRIMTIFMKI